MTITQWIVVGGFVIMYAGLALSHFSHKKGLQQLGQDLENIGKSVEAKAPEIAQVATGVVKVIEEATK